MKRAFASLSISFGVVPEEIRAWKPDTAPQAMVMNRNGNSAPDQTGPVPSTKRRHGRHLEVAARRTGCRARGAMIAPIFRKVER